MKVVIIGANGKIGKMVAQKMSVSPKFEPTAFIRKKEQKAYFDSIGVPVIVESLENTEEVISRKLEGFDAVVFSAGSGGKTGYDKTMEIDLYGAVKVIHAAMENAIKRFVMISAALSGDPGSWPEAMRPYYIAKHLADKELIRSGLGYTILRPVMLSDKEEVGKIMIHSDPHRLAKEIPRVAVAEVVLQVLQVESTLAKILEISEGAQEVDAAIRAFLSE